MVTIGHPSSKDGEGVFRQYMLQRHKELVIHKDIVGRETLKNGGSDGLGYTANL